jgi:hypothetical protein
MPFYERELPEGPVLEIRMQGTEDQVLRGNHVHMCPECFEDLPCDDWCSWTGESTTNAGVPSCHPVICDRCEYAGRQYFDQGGGI